MKLTGMKTFMGIDFSGLIKCGEIEAAISGYGFTEIAAIRIFICISPPTLDSAGLKYVAMKVEECLQKHDDGSAYFYRLHELSNKLSFIK